MSRKHHKECCAPMTMGYGMAGYNMGGTGCANGGIKWLYALLILIVIVLQFGRNYGKGECGVEKSENKDGLIDNSVLFIIVVFLLILCAGCFGGEKRQGAFGFGGGFGY